MPSVNRSQQRLFCMALAVRKGDLARSKVSKSVLDIVDGDMTNKQIEDFTVVKEMRSLKSYLSESIKGSLNIGIGAIIDKWLTDYGFRKESQYVINEDNSVTFFTNVRIKGNLPDYINIEEAKCDFEITGATSLRGCPKKTNRWFCVDDCKLDNLEGMPEEAAGHVCIKNSDIKSLKGLTENVGGILCIGNNKQHFEKNEIERLTNARKIYNYGQIAYTNTEPHLGAFDEEHIKSLVDIEKYEKETNAKLITISTGWGTDIGIRYDFLYANELPYGLASNGIFLLFKYDLDDGKLVFYNQGHLELTEKDKQGKYKYFALKGFMDPLLDKGGKKFRACKAKDIKDVFRRMNEWVKAVYEAAIEDQGGELKRK